MDEDPLQRRTRGAQLPHLIVCHLLQRPDQAAKTACRNDLIERMMKEGGMIMRKRGKTRGEKDGEGKDER